MTACIFHIKALFPFSFSALLNCANISGFRNWSPQWSCCRCCWTLVVICHDSGYNDSTGSAATQCCPRRNRRLNAGLSFAPVTNTFASSANRGRFWKVPTEARLGLRTTHCRLYVVFGHLILIHSKDIFTICKSISPFRTLYYTYVNCVRLYKQCVRYTRISSPSF